MDDKIILNDLVGWWEIRRLWFNVIVGITGISSIIYMDFGFYLFFNIVGIAIYGIIVNIFYSFGVLVELFDLYYLKLKLKTFRLLFFIMGTLFTCFMTICFAINCYNSILID